MEPAICVQPQYPGPRSGSQPPSVSVEEGLRLIRDLAVQLRVPQTAVASAQTFFHRYCLTRSPTVRTAAAALFLAGKVCEVLVRADAVCALLYDIELQHKRKLHPNLQAPPLSEAMRGRLRDSLFACEFELLEASAFEVNIPLPYPFIDLAQTRIQKTHRDAFLRVARSFANDSYQTQLCLWKSAENIAEACVFLAAEYLHLDIDSQPDQEVVAKIIELYKTT